MFDDLKFALSLGSDNHSGIHPKILESLAAANRGHAHAYGMDEVSRLTDLEFKRVFGANVEAHYVFTGTAANVLSLSPLMRGFESVICSATAHLHLDECGAPEKFLGGKLWTVPTQDGRITPAQCEEFLERRGDQHYSQPKVVSLTQPTELGTCYSLEELREWRRWSKEKNLMLHIDGARLANAAVHLKVDLKSLTSDIGVDCVSFGGTKNGLLGAEAVLLFTPQAKDSFKFYRKQAMQLPSKSRFMAAQFYAYLKNDLWREIATHVTDTARHLSEKIKEFPEIRQPLEVQSNGLFVCLPKAWVQPLREHFFFYIWDQQIGMCRWMISFDWTPKQTEDLLQAIREVKKCFPVK